MAHLLRPRLPPVLLPRPLRGGGPELRHRGPAPGRAGVRRPARDAHLERGRRSGPGRAARRGDGRPGHRGIGAARMGGAPARPADGARPARDRDRGGALRGPHGPARSLGRRAGQGGRAARITARATRRPLPARRGRPGPVDRESAPAHPRPTGDPRLPGAAMIGFLRIPWLIAGNTVRELVRSKLLHNLLLFAVLLIAGSMFVAQLTIGQWDRVILDIGLAAIELSGVLVAVLIGRFLGLCAMLAVSVVLMLGVLAGVLRLAGYGVSSSAVIAALLILLELSLMAAAALLFGSFTKPILASAFSLSLFLIGHLLTDLKAFQQ